MLQRPYFKKLNAVKLSNIVDHHGKGLLNSIVQGEISRECLNLE